MKDRRERKPIKSPMRPKCKGEWIQYSVLTWDANLMLLFPGHLQQYRAPPHMDMQMLCKFAHNT